MTEPKHRAFFVNVRRFDIRTLLGPTGELCFITGRGEDIPEVLALSDWPGTTKSGERQVLVVSAPEAETAPLTAALSAHDVTFTTGTEIVQDEWQLGDTIYLFDPDSPGESGHDLLDLLVGYIDVWSAHALAQHMISQCPALAMQLRPRVLIIASGQAPDP